MKTQRPVPNPSHDGEKQEQIATQKEPLYKHVKARLGRPPKFETAGELLDKLVEYCDYCDANPLKVDVRSKMRRNSNSGDSSELGNMTIKRPYTLDGFCLFAGIFSTWAQFKSNAKRREDWSEFETVINACEQVIRDQQITGAMIGVYSERLTARLNGISERIEHEVEQRRTTISFDEYCRLMRGEAIKPER